LLEKKRSSPEVSLSRAMLGVVPTGTRYRLISYSLLSFDKKNISEKRVATSIYTKWIAQVNYYIKKIVKQKKSKKIEK